MFAGVGQTHEPGPLFESTGAERDGRAHSVGHRASLLICQVSALLWKESMDRVRRPRRALVELFLPALVVLVLFYAVSLSPVATIDSFRHADLPTVSLHAAVPNEMNIAYVWEDDVSSVMKWRDVFAELNLSAFFLEYAWTTAKLHNVTRFYKKHDLDTSWSSMWTLEEVTDTVLTNRPAASVFKIPTFDEYTGIISMIQMSIGNAGMKRTMFDDPLIWFIFRFGRLAFAMGDVTETERTQLIVAMEKVIEYLSVTTKTFGNTVICRSDLLNGKTKDCAFQNVQEVMTLTSSGSFTDALWAVVRIDRLSLSEPEFRYAVLINRTLMPRWMSIETFPQGLGKEYATYAYTGVLTLQYELNTYFAALVGGQQQQQQQTKDKLPLTVLVDSICDAVPTPHNATRGLFIIPTDEKQQKLVENVTTKNPIESDDVQPFIEREAIFAPCRYEVTAFCEKAKNTTSLTECLDKINEKSITATCRGAVQFIKQCLKTTICKNESVFDLLTNVPSKLPSCVDSVPATCAAKDYPHAVAQIRSAATCADELQQVCTRSFWGQNIFTECTRYPTKGIPNSGVCQAVLDSFQPCLDEYESICPTKQFGDAEAIPYACLYINTHILSDSCKATRLVKEILPNMFTREVIRHEVAAATYYCREVHDIQKTLTSSIVVQAFPTKSYNQHLFFLSGGPFVGLLLAAAYYFPFASSVRSVARERESWQHMYMILIGAHPLAILFSRFLASFIMSIIISLIVVWAMMISVDVPSWVLYGLLYMYSLSLSAFSLVIGAVIPTEKAAAIISPFIMFLSVAPALSLNHPTEISGFSSILPPTVLAKAVNQFTRGEQTGYVMSAVGPFTPQRALWTLFGLTFFYGLIAVLLEYLILPNSGLSRLFHRMTNKITSLVDRLMKRQRRRMASHFGGAETIPQDNYIPSSSSNPRTTEFNIGGINNTAEVAARFQPNAGVGIPVSAELHDRYPPAGESLASLMSPSGAGTASPTPPTTFWPRVPPSWRTAVAVRDLEFDIPGLGMGLRIPQADFFRDQLNCLVGRAGSGKSLLLQVLMGWTEMPYGSVQINGRDIWTKGHDGGGIGVCLQRTVVWENMTVAENIRLVQLLSGRIADDVELVEELDALTSALQLVDVSCERAGRLTPGLARKLAVAMAFAGGARTVFLDEPTAFTDLSSRAEIWRIISQNTRQRCIIVATGDVDQVGHFADHVTVLHRGRVSMAGTPDYIKRRLCGGWVVTVCRAFHTRAIDILDRVMAVAPDAVLVSNVSNELAFRIPEDASSVYLPRLLTEMQHARQCNLITSIAVSDAHFSEAFVRLARALDLRDPQSSDSDDQNDDDEYNNHNSSGRSLPNDDPATTASSGAHYTTMSSAHSLLQSTTLSSYHRIPENSPSAAAIPHRTPLPLNTIGTVVDCETLYTQKSGVFLRTWRAILYYCALDAVLSPFYAFLFLLFPLALISFSTSFIGSNIIYERFTESSLMEWEISSSPSTSYYAQFGGETSPYRKLMGILDKKKIRGTMSDFSQLENNVTEGVAINSSVALDEFLHEKGYPSNYFLFGALALQGPMFTILNTSSDSRAHFPWVTDVVLHNTSYPPSLPVYVQLLGMMRIWAVSNDMNATISASVGVSETELQRIMPSTVTVMSALLLLLPFAFYGSRMVANLVEQRRSGLLQVLYSSSLHPVAFWLGNFTYDILSFTILSIAGIVLYDFSTIVVAIPRGGMMTSFGTMIIFGCSIISLSYVISKCFKNPIAAQSFAIGLGIFTGFVILIASSAVRFLPNNPMTVSSINSNEGFAKFMRLFPLFNLGEYFMHYALDKDPYGDSAPGLRLLPLIVPIMLFIFLILYESMLSINVRTFFREKVWRFVRKAEARVAAQANTWVDGPVIETALYRWEDPSALVANEDPSVVEERSKSYTADGVHAAKVWKKYHNDIYALQNISVNVEGESLAVVGVNGCGKSTLLRCFSGDLLPSHGSVFVNGYCSSFNTFSRLNANRSMGYATASVVLQECSLTPYIFLNVMADLRMVRRGEMRKQHILFLLRTLGIEQFMHISLFLLSVSVQRRVEIAAALIGYPPVLVLDDLTGSLDPMTRRQVWAAVKSSPHGTTTVLSTRSPDDVEMLGDRVLLLDGGMMKFVGTPTEWRHSHRSGFKVSIDVPRPIEARGNRSYHAEKRDLLQQFFAAHWEGSSLVDSQPFHYVFHIPFSDAQDEEIGISSSSHTEGVSVVGIRSILSILILGRNSGWEVQGGTGVQMYFKCSITVSEISVEDTAMAAFTKYSRNLYDRNYYVPPRSYSESA